ncbi:hypothetical protein AMTRI_Chr10g233280 [Amborella trichopoda]
MVVEVTTGKKNLWEEVIEAKCRLGNSGWLPNFPRHRASRAWTSIARSRITYKNNIRFKVGSGERIRFWRDHWLGNQHLGISSPSLHSIATNEEAIVAEYVEQRGNSLPLQEVFIPIIDDDVMGWSPSPSSIFDFILLIIPNLFTRLLSIINNIWLAPVPQKVQASAWILVQGKLLTVDQLQR